MRGWFIYDIINKGELKAAKFGRSMRARRADLDAKIQPCRL